jgi:hypothetical protein
MMGYSTSALLRFARALPKIFGVSGSKRPVHPIWTDAYSEVTADTKSRPCAPFAGTPADAPRVDPRSRSTFVNLRFAMPVLGLLVASLPWAEAMAEPSCRQAWRWPCPANDPWNTPIGSNALYSSRSDPRVVSLNRHNRAGLNTTSWSIVVAKGNDQLTIRPGGWFPGYANFTTFQLRGPAGTRPTAGTDAHINFVQPDDATNIELYGVRYVNGTTLEASMKKTNNIRQRCVGERMGSFSGTRAYGGSSIGGLIRDWEVQGNNQIRHALALAVCYDQLRVGPVWPATAQDSGWQHYSGAIPMGSLFAIPRSVNIESLGLNQYGKKLAYAAQRYGALIVDQGCGPAFYGEPRLTPSIATAIRSDTLRVLRQLIVVTNNTRSTPGGGGTPTVPTAPPFCAP